MFNNLLSREGLITTKGFFNPCCSIRSISGEESIFQSGKQIYKYPQHEDPDLHISHFLFADGAQESGKATEEEEQLEPKITEFLACLVPKEEYQPSLESKDTKERIQSSQESIKSWTESVFQFQPFTLQQFLKTRSYEKLVPHVMVFVHIHYVNTNILKNLIRRWLHWKYSYT